MCNACSGFEVWISMFILWERVLWDCDAPALNRTCLVSRWKVNAIHPTKTSNDTILKTALATIFSVRHQRAMPYHANWIWTDRGKKQLCSIVMYSTLRLHLRIHQSTNSDRLSKCLWFRIDCNSKKETHIHRHRRRGRRERKRSARPTPSLLRVAVACRSPAFWSFY